MITNAIKLGQATLSQAYQHKKTVAATAVMGVAALAIPVTAYIAPEKAIELSHNMIPAMTVIGGFAGSFAANIKLPHHIDNTTRNLAGGTGLLIGAMGGFVGGVYLEQGIQNFVQLMQNLPFA